MSVLVFGRGGQVATELQRQGAVRALGREAADLSRPESCSAAIDTHEPTLVINAAAWTAVDRAETQEAAATRVNAEAPGAMAAACAARGIPFLHISTDYVFDGSGLGARRETDPVAPQNAYGRSKLAGELQVMEAGGPWAILRTAWVFSAHGANFVKTMLRLSETRDRLDIVADQIGCPTPAADIAAALLTMGRAMQDGHAGGLYHYAGQPPVSWADFARAIFRQAGRAVAVADIPTSQYPTPAERPLDSRLDCAKLAADFGITPPDWRAGLQTVLNELDTT
jgi:dTDP-4-dehydrorhamnose reductase